jgi:hypothetical protein
LIPAKTLKPKNSGTAYEGLNHMLDSWNTEKLVVPSLVLTSTSVSTRLVTVGPGGDVDIYRPPKLEEGQVFISTGDIDYRLAKMSAEDYGQISSLTISGDRASSTTTPALQSPISTSMRLRT